MKYTKDNIVGVHFISSGDEYRINKIEGNQAMINYYPEREGRDSWGYHLNMMIDNLNEQAWPIKMQENYEIY